MAKAKLNKARQPTEKRSAAPVEANKRLEQKPVRSKRADRLRDAEINISPGILTILDALPFYVMLIDERHNILLANKAVRDQLNRVLAMQMGADDYITKPFDVTEFKAITTKFFSNAA
jgi:CheY-like chemotaxis protein